MLSVDHIGYAVKRMEKAITDMETMGFCFGDRIADSDRKIELSFGEKDGYRIELVSPSEKGSPVDQILNDTGPSPYHICYRSDDFEGDLRKMTRGGYRIVIKPAPAVAFDGRRVAFLYSLALGLVEIVES